MYVSVIFKEKEWNRENLVIVISVIFGNIELFLKFLNFFEIVLYVLVIMFYYRYLNVFKNIF